MNSIRPYEFAARISKSISNNSNNLGSRSEANNNLDFPIINCSNIGLCEEIFTSPRSNAFTNRLHKRLYNDTTISGATKAIERLKRKEEATRARIEQKEEWSKLRLEKAKKIADRLQRRELARQRKLWELKQSLKEQEMQRLENETAIKLQAVARGFCSRRLVQRVLFDKQCEDSATIIQAFARRKLAYNVSLTMRRNRLRKLRYRNAVKIQAVYRGFGVRRRLRREKEEATARKLEDAAKRAEEMRRALPTIEKKVQSPAKALSLKKQTAPPVLTETVVVVPAAVVSESNASPTTVISKTNVRYKRIGGGFKKITAGGEKARKAVLAHPNPYISSMLPIAPKGGGKKVIRASRRKNARRTKDVASGDQKVNSKEVAKKPNNSRPRATIASPRTARRIYK